MRTNSPLNTAQLAKQYQSDVQKIRTACTHSIQPYLRAVRINCVPDPQLYWSVAEEWQKTICGAVGPAFEHIAKVRYAQASQWKKFWITLPRGSDKTSLIGRMANWLIAFSPKTVTGVLAASSKDQAKLLRNAMESEARLNPWLGERIEFLRGEVRSRVTNSTMSVISADTSSSYGHLVDFILCDELTNWKEGEPLWHSLVSTQPKRGAVLVALMNAGWSTTWQWEARCRIITQPDWFVWEPTGEDCIAGWIDPKEVEEQRAILPPPVFNRLWLNMWSGERGDYLLASEIAPCTDPKLKYRANAASGKHAFVVSIDYGEKEDRTVITVMHREGDHVIVDQMKLFVPLPGKPVNVSTVEEYMEKLNRLFGHPLFILDPWQLIALEERAKSKGMRTERWSTSQSHQQELAQVLRTSVLSQRVRWYPNCGYHEQAGNNLAEELADLVVIQTERGWKFDHKSGRKHGRKLFFDDRAMSLGMGLSTLMSQPAGGRDAEIWV